MQYRHILSPIVLCVILGACSKPEPVVPDSPRSLYVYSFGGIEDMEVPRAVEMLTRLGYAGIAAEARGERALARLDEFYESSDRLGDDFQVASVFMAHRFDKYGFSDAGHKAAIDRMAGKEGYLWVWVRNANPDGSVTDAQVESFTQGILDYAISKNVKVILYPHYNTYYPTTEDALRLVEKINHPSFGVAINLCHELMSEKGDSLKKTFEMAKDRIFAVILSGAKAELDKKSVRTRNQSTIQALDESPYDLRPFMRLIKESGFEGPVGFINFKLSDPEDYLNRSIARWNELCEEVGLYEKAAAK